MNNERNTSQEQAGAHNAPEGVSNERLAQQSTHRTSVEDRAAEIARIEGRSPDNIRDEDRERAREELAAVPSEIPSTPPPEGPASSWPRATTEGTSTPEEDEQQIAEQQARRGVREAEHNTMIHDRDVEEEDTDSLRP